jgi:ribosomal protein L40E
MAFSSGFSRREPEKRFMRVVLRCNGVSPPVAKKCRLMRHKAPAINYLGNKSAGKGLV